MTKMNAFWLAMVVGSALGLLVQAGASAGTYELVEGSLTLYETGRTQRLDGRLHFSVAGSSPEDPLQVVRVNSFFLSSGDRFFGPTGPLQHAGLTPISLGLGEFPSALLRSPSHVLIQDGEVVEMLLSAGGEPFDSDSAQVTFRFYDFVADDSEHDSRGFLPAGPRSRHEDEDDDPEDEAREDEDEDDDEHDEDEAEAAGLPGVLEVEGSLLTWERTYAILSAAECRAQRPLPPVDRPQDGTVIIGPGPGLGDLEISLPSGPPLPPQDGAVIIIGPDGDLEISLPPRPRPLPPRDGASVFIVQRPLRDLPGAELTRATGGRSPGFGDLRGVRWNSIVVRSSPDFANGPMPIRRFVNPPNPPGLAEIGMEAPSGAQVSFDDAGVLTVITDGDLYWSGFLSDLPGLTHLELHAASIFVAGDLDLPPGVSISLVAVDQIVIGTPPGEVELPNPPPRPDGLEDGCLLALFQSDPREIGSFEMEAVRVRTVELEVGRGGWRGGARFGQNRGIWAVVFGADSLDVRDIRRVSWRAGLDGEAVEVRRGGRRHRQRDWNQDGYRDLVVRLDPGHRENPVGAGEICMSARLRDGGRIQGCDSIGGGFGYRRGRTR